MSAAIHPITMPKWGLAMEEGTLAVRQVAEGAEIAAGAEIAEIETSKITNVFESPVAGVLRRWVAAEGESVPVGALLAVVAEAGAADDEIDAFIAGFASDFAARAAETAAPPAPETLATNLGRIRYLRLGAGEATPLILIHGFGGDLGGWLFNQPVLAESRPVIAFDLPGHGGSEKEGVAGSIDSLIAALAALMEGLGVGRAHLAGHSLGGAVALAHAAAHPARVASLTLIAPAGLGPEINTAYIEGYLTASRRRPLRAVLELLVANPKLISRDMVEDVLRFKRLDGALDALANIAAATFPEGRQALDLRDALGRLAMPAQVIWGEADRILPAAHAEGLPTSIAVHRLDDTGHLAHMEGAAAVNRLIERHMDLSE